MTNIIHKIFNRHGGASHEPYNSLNVCFGIGDNEDDVLENRGRICKELGINMGNLVSLNQVHGAQILHVNGDTHGEVDGYDAMLTDQPDKFLMIQVADCQAVMIWSDVKDVVANVHNGWKGSAQNIVGKTLTKMINEFQAHPSSINVEISPSIGPCCAQFTDPKKELPEHLHQFIVDNNHVDFWAATKKQCLDYGLIEDKIKCANICTVCNKKDYFSHRGENEGTGRFAAVIGMKS